MIYKLYVVRFATLVDGVDQVDSVDLVDSVERRQAVGLSTPSTKSTPSTNVHLHRATLFPAAPFIDNPP